MKSWRDFSSSTNRIRKLLCGGVAKQLLLDRLSRLKRQPHREGATPVQSRAGRLDLSSVLRDDAVADGQPKAGALAGAAACVERLEDVFQHLRPHAATRV